MIELGLAFAAGVIFSESVRRAWGKYVSPKLAKLSSSVLP